jgi:hypothetical protein
MWDRYGQAANAGGSLRRTHSLPSRKGRLTDDRQKIDGFYGVGNNSIRTATAWGCDDRLPRLDPRDRPRSGEIGRRDPDMVAADLTNNLIEGVVLVPSVVAYIVELQNAGFTYAKAA